MNSALLIGRVRVGAVGLVATLVALLASAGLTAAPARAAGNATYTATQTIPVPPASAYQGSGGGDGWNIALSDKAVYNLFHHAGSFTVACHTQADASPCWSPKTLTGPDGEDFAVSGHSTLWLTGTKLYAYADRTSDSTVGVACFDTTKADSGTDPYCGFTPLTAAGAGTLNGGFSQISMAALVGTKRYAFNFNNGTPAPGAGGRNELLCFDTATSSACSGQPVSPIDTGADDLAVPTYPTPSVVALDSRVLIGYGTTAGATLAGCYDTVSQGACGGSWPASLPADAWNTGAPFPTLTAAGTVTGFCVPANDDPCYGLDGVHTSSPPDLAAVISANTPWNGPAVVIGSRVYVADGNNNRVDCYDYSARSACINFPKTLPNSGYTYTINSDPQRPACLWTNADNGSAQLQNFDAYSGAACGEGPVRVLASSFVVDTNTCRPATYGSLQITEPVRSSYTDGYVEFRDANGLAISSVGDRKIGADGTVDLSGLSLSSASGLPQFLVTLNGTNGRPGAVGVKLTWTGVDDPSCVRPGTVTTPGGAASTCPDAFFVAMLGSGQYYTTDEDLSMSPQLTAMYRAMLTKTRRNSVRLKVVNYYATSVNAITAGLSTAPNKVALFQKLSSNADAYLNGEKLGVARLAGTITGIEASCPSSKIVLAGYSQGAMAIHDWANTASSGTHPSVVGIGLLADPERVDASTVVNFGTAAYQNRGLLNSHGVCAVINAVKNCAAPEQLADISPKYASRAVQVCDVYDIVCDTTTVATNWVVNTKQGRNTLVNLAEFVHASYSYTQGTKTAGMWLGQRVSRR